MNIEQEVQKLDVQIMNMVDTLDNIKEIVLKKDEVVDIDYRQLERMAMKSKFQKHIVEKLDDEIAYKYCLALASATQIVENKSKSEKQMYLMYRIFHTKNNELIAKNIMRDVRIFTVSDLEMVVNSLSDDEVFNLLVDMLLMMSLDGEVDEEQAKYMSEVFAYVGFDERKIILVGRVVKAILMCNEEELCFLAKAVDVNNYLGYIGVDSDFYVVGKFSDISKNKHKKIKVAGDTVKDVKIIIDCDTFGKDEITFVGCHFERITGIKALKTKVNIIDCEFVDCVQARPKEKRSSGELYYPSTNETTYFMEIKHATIENSKFNNCVVKGYGENSRTFMFTDSIIKNCTFESCRVWLVSNTAELLNVSDSTIEKCIFNNCTVYGKDNSPLGRIIRTSYLRLINAKHSVIVDNRFVNSSCEMNSSSIRDRDTVFNYMIGYGGDNHQKNNKFENCVTAQSKYESSVIKNDMCGAID